jgi:hypothetical protein
MVMSSPDFTRYTKDALAKRAGQTCSNPNCRRRTSGAHSEKDKAINLGEAAHIRAARLGPRYDSNMTDKERRDISNGIWLCRECARLIDIDDTKYTAELLISWKQQNEETFRNSKSSDNSPAREINVKDGGVGSIIQNTGEGIAVDVSHSGKSPAEKITVEGSGIGEIVINSGKGTAKRIISFGGEIGSETSVTVNKPVQMAVGMMSKLVLTTCSSCGMSVQFSKVIQGLAGDSEPKAQVNCPYCGMSTWI